ncbi:MAG: DUF72 domain-containing protein, partial [Candidatus Thermoplasmatota archaeon]
MIKQIQMQRMDSIKGQHSMARIYIGTSGWAYNWNIKGSIEWYKTNSSLNAVELNMSFYRFPRPNQIKTWAEKAGDIAWVIKVHRSITHHQDLREKINDFQRFKSLFTPLERSIHYYLLQLPRTFHDINSFEYFIKESNEERLAVEIRNPAILTDDIIELGKKLGFLLVSVDAPSLPSDIMSESIIYMRVHGRDKWYSHSYSQLELSEIKKRIMSKKPR